MVERTAKARITDGEGEKEEERKKPERENRWLGCQLMFISILSERIRSLSDPMIDVQS